MKILIIALSGLGDALMFSPALKVLRTLYPNATIDLLTMFGATKDVYKNNPDINTIIYKNFLKDNPLSSLSFLFSLRGNYDISINVFPANRFPYNIISWLIGAKKRLGHNYIHVNDRSLNFLNNYRIDEDDSLHNVQENIRLVELLGTASKKGIPPLQLFLDNESKEYADKWMLSHTLDDKSTIIGFHAGSALFKNQVNKRWDKNKYASLANTLKDRYKATILLFGGPEEKELNMEIASQCNAIIVETPSLITTLAIMKKCRLFVSNDSGLMHCAAALQIPTVAIFGYTSHVHTKPWGNTSSVVRLPLPCSPCFYFSPQPAQCREFKGDEQFKCMKEISIQQVLEACNSLLLNNTLIDHE